jgi:hypothetical protein
MEAGSSHAKVLPKNLLVLDRKNKDSGDLLSQLPVHAGSQGGEVCNATSKKEAKQ